MTKEELIDSIRNEFKGVKLNGGIGLNAAQAIDDYAYDSIDEKYAYDEKENWENISMEELDYKRGSLYFFDPNGYLFLLPAFLICELREKLSFNLIDVFSNRSNEELALIFSQFNFHQIAVLVNCFEILYENDRFDSDAEDIQKLIVYLKKIVNTKLPLSDKNFTGKWGSLYENGFKQYEAEYKDGKQNGKVTTWYRNGEKKSEVDYQEGLANGKSITWYPNGIISTEGFYKEGKRIDKFFVWYQNGVLQYLGDYNSLDGTSNFKEMSWFKNGIKKYEREWKNHKLSGKLAEWDENGNITKDQEYKNGVMIKDYLS